jgi:S-adenosylmethionine decarboxylase
MSTQLHRTGRHLVLDCVADAHLLRDRAFMERALRTVAELADMDVLEVSVVEVPEDPSVVGAEPFRDPGGLTGVAILSTSHASFHAFPLTGELRFDLYSCKDFDPDVVENYLKGTLRCFAVESLNWVR